MLLKLSKRLCPLLSLALTVGCGKKVNEATTTEGGRTTENQAYDSFLTFQVNETQTSRKTYLMPRDGIFILPSHLQVIRGNPAGKKVRLTYNIFDDQDYEFHCDYLTQSNSDEIPLSKCASSDGRDYGVNASTIIDYRWPMDQGKFLQMDILNSSHSELTIDATHLVDWLQPIR
jgi:hypothetical protein